MHLHKGALCCSCSSKSLGLFHSLEVLRFNCRSFLTLSFPSESRVSFHNSEIEFRELEKKSLDSHHL